MGIRREVTIDGTTYALSTYHERPYRRFAQSSIVGQDKERYWSTWPQRTWHGGERMQRILDAADMEAGRYHDGEGVNVSEWGQVTLQPALTRSLAISSDTLPIVVNAAGTTAIAGITATPYIKIGTYNGTTITWANPSSNPGAAVTKLLVAGSAIYAVTSGGKVFSSADSGATWAEVGSYTTATGLAYVNNKLYVLKGATEVYNHTDSETVCSYGGTHIAGFRDNLYWASDHRLWTYDGNADYEYVKFPQGFNVTGLYPYRMAMWVLGYYKVQGGYKGSIHYIMPGTENHLYTLGDYSADHRIYACSGDDNEVWFASPKRGGADRYDLEQGGISSGPATGTAMYIPPGSMASLEGFLLIGRYDNVGATDGIYAADVASPAAYRATGWFTSPAFDFGYPYDEKVMRAIRINHKRLAANESIKVEYSLDMGVTYHYVGTSSILGATSCEWKLTDPCVGDSIKLKITLVAGTTAGTTPTLRTVTVQGAPRLPNRWQWELALSAYRRNRGAQDKEDLEVSFNKAMPVTFVDRDNQAYTVTIEDIEFQEMMVDKDSAVIVLTLREV